MVDMDSLQHRRRSAHMLAKLMSSVKEVMWPWVELLLREDHTKASPLLRRWVAMDMALSQLSHSLNMG
jgi:hypothetical protein